MSDNVTTAELAVAMSDNVTDEEAAASVGVLVQEMTEAAREANAPLRVLLTIFPPGHDAAVVWLERDDAAQILAVQSHLAGRAKDRRAS
jgi:hypothetical protein